MRPALILLMGLALAGCATTDATTQQDIQDAHAAIHQFTDQDLANALLWAQYHGDKAGEQCIRTVQDLRLRQDARTLPPITGPLSAFEAASGRIEQQGTPAWLVDLNLGCAAKFTKINFTILKLLGKGMSGGLAP